MNFLSLTPIHTISCGQKLHVYMGFDESFKVSNWPQMNTPILFVMSLRMNSKVCVG